MKNIYRYIALFVLAAASYSLGDMTLTYFLPSGAEVDPNDPFMDGAQMRIVVSSDSDDFWQGGLFVRDANRDTASIWGRGYDANTRDYTDSHYADAGDFARVTGWKDSVKWGVDMSTFYAVDGNSEDDSTQIGDWFVVDYCAIDVGTCQLEFFDYTDSWDDPNRIIEIEHVRSCDFVDDNTVNFKDFAVFSAYWLDSDCNDPNWCDGTDLDTSGKVDANDLRLFTNLWLWNATPISEPNDRLADPNIEYRIVSLDNDNDIYMDVNEVKRLYVKMTTTDANDVAMFDIEVILSDPNLGSIYNTAYDAGSPNDPNYAEILATPRDPNWDYWGPGLGDDSALGLVGVNTDHIALSDGNLASFELTYTGPNDLTLELINWGSYNTDDRKVYPVRKKMIIRKRED